MRDIARNPQMSPPTLATRVLAGVLCILPVCLPGRGAPVTRLEITRDNASLLDHIEEFPSLEVLSISCLEPLQAVPDAIGKLTKLKELVIDNGNGCAMNPRLPEAIGNLQSLERLTLYGAQDPRHPGSQPAERHPFPRGMSRLKNLVYLDLGRNGLEEIPSFVKDLPRLRELGFAWNVNVKAIPGFIATLREVRTLRLDGDGLDDLPDLLNAPPHLDRITLGDNCRITGDAAKMNDLRRRFPRIRFDFADEFICPGR